MPMTEQRRRRARLSAWIESRITVGDFPPGSRLPGLRELAGQFELTAYAAHRVLRKLEERGVIELRHGAGAYVAANRLVDGKAGVIRLLMSSRNLTKNYLSHALLGVQDCLEEAGYSILLQTRNYMEQEFYDPVADGLPGEAGVFYLGGYDYLEREPDGTLPAVGLEMSSTCGGRLSPVTLDPLAAAELATDFFRRRGVKRVRAFYTGQDPTHAWRFRCFSECWRAIGGALTEVSALYNCDVELGDEEGWWFSGGTFCEGLLRQQQEHAGLDWRRKRTILSLDGKCLVLPQMLRVNTLAVDWVQAGRIAAEELLYRIAHPGEGARRILLIPKLVEMDSDGVNFQT